MYVIIEYIMSFEQNPFLKKENAVGIQNSTDAVKTERRNQADAVESVGQGLPSRTIENSDDVEMIKVREKPIVDEEYSIQMDYGPLPPFDELEKEFGKGAVASEFDGLKWQNHQSCKGKMKSGEKIMKVKLFDDDFLKFQGQRVYKHFYFRSDDAIFEMERRGYRPATHIELLAFVKQNPDLCSRLVLIATGSFVKVSREPLAAEFTGRERTWPQVEGSTGKLGVTEWSNKYHTAPWYLFVRKDDK